MGQLRTGDVADPGVRSNIDLIEIERNTID
jgi:hypothetical protein